MARGFVDGALLHATEDVRRDESGEKEVANIARNLPREKKGENFLGRRN